MRWAIRFLVMHRLLPILSLFLFCIIPSLALAQAQPKRWEKAITAMEAESAEPGGIVFTGSSSIRLWKTLAEDFPGMNAINRGFGGSKIADATHFFERIVAPLKPRQVVIYAGGNDINAKATAEQVFEDFKAFIAKARSVLPGVPIAYISIAGNPARWKQVETVKAANASIEAYCKTLEGVQFIDIFPLLLDAQGLPRPELFVADKLHMNPDGYAIWTKAVAPFLIPATATSAK